MACTLPPKGWYCTRDPGHPGPCAAYEYFPDLEAATRALNAPNPVAKPSIRVRIAEALLDLAASPTLGQNLKYNAVKAAAEIVGKAKDKVQGPKKRKKRDVLGLRPI